MVIRTADDGSPVRITLQSLEVLTLTEADEDSAADTTKPSATAQSPPPNASTSPNSNSRDQLPRRYEAVLTDNVRVTLPGQREVRAETAITRFGGNTITLSELPPEQPIPGRAAFVTRNAFARVEDETCLLYTSPSPRD